MRLRFVLFSLPFSLMVGGCAHGGLFCGSDPLKRAEPTLTRLEPGDGLTALLVRLAEWSHAERQRSLGIDEIVVTISKRQESITNNQVGGVDEGDFVKHMGDWIILLRRGRIFVLDIGTHVGSPIRKLGQHDIAASDEGLEAWYDELLVFDKTIVLIGYVDGGSILALYDVDAGGTVVHRETFVLPSFDYYSGDGYATRKVGDQLLFYLPIPLFEASVFDPNTGEIALQVARRSDGSLHPLLESLELYSPLQHSLDPVAHTIVSCEIGMRTLSCRGKGVIGPGWSEMFVSRTATYLWIEGGNGWALDTTLIDGTRYGAALASGALDRWQEADEGVLYRLPFGGGTPGAVALDGQPRDSFSFREREDRLQLALHGLGAREEGVGWTEIPLDAFGLALTEWPWGFIRPIAQEGRFCELYNRFVGDHLILGGCNSRRNGILIAQPTEEAGEAFELPLPFLLSRLEEIDSELVVVGHTFTEAWEPTDMTVRSYSVAGSIHELSAVTYSGQIESEGRSHGFNFGAFGEGWLLGVPTQSQTDRERRWEPEWRTPGEISYLYLDEQRSLRAAGKIAQDHEALDRDDACQVSCIDWYGSARPFFLGERIFGLMDYELIEAHLLGGQVHEIQRMDALEP